MGGNRITIARLMGLVVPVAIGLVAIRKVLEMETDSILYLAFGLDMAAIGVAIESGGRARKIAIGYAVSGLGYFVLGSVTPGFDSVVLDNPIAPRLMGWVAPGSGTDRGSFHYQLVAHSLFDIIAGIAGGLMAGALARGAHDPARSTTSPTGQP